VGSRRIRAVPKSLCAHGPLLTPSSVPSLIRFSRKRTLRVTSSWSATVSAKATTNIFAIRCRMSSNRFARQLSAFGANRESLSSDLAQLKSHFHSTTRILKRCHHAGQKQATPSFCITRPWLNVCIKICMARSAFSLQLVLCWASKEEIGRAANLSSLKMFRGASRAEVITAIRVTASSSHRYRPVKGSRGNYRVSLAMVQPASSAAHATRSVSSITTQNDPFASRSLTSDRKGN